MEDQVADGRSDFRLHSDVQQLKGIGAGTGWCADKCTLLICLRELGGLILETSVMKKKNNGVFSLSKRGSGREETENYLIF